MHGSGPENDKQVRENTKFSILSECGHKHSSVSGSMGESMTTTTNIARQSSEAVTVPTTSRPTYKLRSTRRNHCMKRRPAIVMAVSDRPAPIQNERTWTWVCLSVCRRDSRNAVSSECRGCRVFDWAKPDGETQPRKQ